MTGPPAPPAPFGPAPPLVGRERAQTDLRAALTAALAGRGTLALISGDAGIGKTTLAEWLAAEAAGQGSLVLSGDCHDLAETPPYGPWVELLASAPIGMDFPPPPDLAGSARLTSEIDAVARTRAYLTALAGRHPLLLVLEDLHWADPASLDLLRGLARTLATLPLVLLVTYRAEELTRDHPLYTLLPVLVREARPRRIDLTPLIETDLHALVAARYVLPDGDGARLAAWLQTRSGGNPFYAGELLRGLEEQGVLRQASEGWELTDLAEAALPALLRQVIDSRIARLSAEAQRTLAVAAVIGLEAPLALWAGVSGTDEETLLAIVSEAEENRLLTVSGDGSAVRFAHALIREALYAGTPAVQRRAWHRRTGEHLASLPGPDPDAVAFHFQRAGDGRSVTWLLQAAARAERAYAYRSAADRCAAALALLEREGAAAGERGWLGYRIAALRRYRDPRGALAVLESVAGLAAEAGDRPLAACSLFLRGNLHCYAGEFGSGLAALEQGRAALDALTTEEGERLRAVGAAGGFVPDTRRLRGTLVMRLAGTGRFHDACRVGGGLFAPDALAERGTDGQTGVNGPRDATQVRAEPDAPDTGDLPEANALRGFAVARAALGRPHEARAAFARARAIFQRLGDHFHIGMAATQELQWVALPYRADHTDEWEGLAAEAERAWARASDAPADLPEGFARLPVLLQAGNWSVARALALAVYEGGGSYKASATRALAILAREQGDGALAARLIKEELPAGPDTPVGTANFSAVLLLQRLAVARALTAGNLDEAREWLEAHDRWLEWSGAVLGRAERELEWAAYHRAADDNAEARRRTECALQSAREPTQPLALLAAHRLLGELDTAASEHVHGLAHLERALALAGACAAPYERALTLLALAEHHLATGERTAARAFSDEARSILLLLHALPALARAEALRARLPARPAGQPLPAGLSEREVEVLRLVAAGDSNREIASALTLSVRTVEKHVAHVYAKIGARGRADAASFAVQHGLLSPAQSRR